MCDLGRDVVPAASRRAVREVRDPGHGIGDDAVELAHTVHGVDQRPRKLRPQLGADVGLDLVLVHALDGVQIDADAARTDVQAQADTDVGGTATTAAEGQIVDGAERPVREDVRQPGTAEGRVAEAEHILADGVGAQGLLERAEKAFHRTLALARVERVGRGHDAPVAGDGVGRLAEVETAERRRELVDENRLELRQLGDEFHRLLDEGALVDTGRLPAVAVAGRAAAEAVIDRRVHGAGLGLQAIVEVHQAAQVLRDDAVALEAVASDRGVERGGPQGGDVGIEGRLEGGGEAGTGAHDASFLL